MTLYDKHMVVEVYFYFSLDTVVCTDNSFFNVASTLTGNSFSVFVVNIRNTKEKEKQKSKGENLEKNKINQPPRLKEYPHDCRLQVGNLTATVRRGAFRVHYTYTQPHT